MTLKLNANSRPILINFDDPTESMSKRRREAIKEHRNGERKPVFIRPLPSGPTPCPGLLEDDPPRNY